MTDAQSASCSGDEEFFADKSVPSVDRFYYSIADDTKDLYSLGPDSEPQPGVPKGRIIEGRHVGKGIYAGVERSYSVYIPAQYDGSAPAALMVVQDGLDYRGEHFRATTALDNLIARGEAPITVAVLVEGGDRGPGYPVFGGNDNRSIEYDTVSDAYATFLIDEFLPEVLGALVISDCPGEKVIVGFSSGGNAAFTAAWYRPDYFGNVIAHCGTFCDVRGGNVHISNIRRNPRKPIRIWHQSGSRDARVVFGDLPIANHDMAAAFEYRFYDHRFVFGEGGHTLRHGGRDFPQTLRWIWRDHPATSDAY